MNIPITAGRIIRAPDFQLTEGGEIPEHLGFLLPSNSHDTRAYFKVIEREVVAAFGLTVGDLHIPGRPKRGRLVTWPRQVAIALMAKLSFQTLDSISDYFGLKRGSCPYAVISVNNAIASYPAVRTELARIESNIMDALIAANLCQRPRELPRLVRHRRKRQATGPARQ